MAVAGISFRVEEQQEQFASLAAGLNQSWKEPTNAEEENVEDCGEVCVESGADCEEIRQEKSSAKKEVEESFQEEALDDWQSGELQAVTADSDSFDDPIDGLPLRRE